LDRPLRTEEDYRRFLGHLVVVHTFEPLDRRRHFVGHLKSLESGIVVIEEEDGRRLEYREARFRKHDWKSSSDSEANRFPFRTEESHEQRNTPSNRASGAGEKGIEVDVIIRAVEDAYAARFQEVPPHQGGDRRALQPKQRRPWKSSHGKKWSTKRGEPRSRDLSRGCELVDPSVNLESTVEIPRPVEGLGRIAAQAAKQIIFQKVREAERENIYKDTAAGSANSSMDSSSASSEAACPSTWGKPKECFRRKARPSGTLQSRRFGSEPSSSM
jgi:hypothetical protein